MIQSVGWGHGTNCGRGMQPGWREDAICDAGAQVRLTSVQAGRGIALLSKSTFHRSEGGVRAGLQKKKPAEPNHSAPYCLSKEHPGGNFCDY